MTIHPYYTWRRRYAWRRDDSNPNTIPDGGGQWVYTIVHYGYALAQASTFGTGNQRPSGCAGLGEQVGIQAVVDWLGTRVVEWKCGIEQKSHAGTTNEAATASEHLKPSFTLGPIGVQKCSIETVL